MRLVSYTDTNGKFDYEKYRKAQVDGNHTKIDNNWTYKPAIEMLSGYIVAKIGIPKFGICHGTRRGNEQLWFRQFLGMDVEVIGTEISDTAKQFPYTVQHDFHEQRLEWIGKADFVYSNSWDHTYDPNKAFHVWMESLRPGGIMLIEHSMGHLPEYTSEMDPFGVTFRELVEFIDNVGAGKFSVIDKIESFEFAVPQYMGELKFVVVGNNQ